MYDTSPARHPADLPADAPLTGYLTTWEFILSFEVLIFGIVVLAVLFMMFRSRQATAADVIRGLCVTLVIVGSLFCITAGFGQGQIAPVVGLFGTIVGYVIGQQGKLQNDPHKDAEIEEKQG